MSDDQQKRSPNRWLVTILALFGVGLLFCGGPITWFLIRNSRAAAEVESRRQEIVDRGLPIDDDSLTSFRYRTMEHKNSERWMAILDELEGEAFRKASATIPILGRPADETPFVPGEPYPLDDEVSEFLAEWKPLLVELHEVLEGSGSIWTEVEFDSFNTLLPYSQTARAAARLLTLEFEDAVRRGDGDRVYHSLLALIGNARAMENEPVLISHLVHIALMRVAIDNVSVAVEEGLLSPEQLLALLGELNQLPDYRSQFDVAVAGERAMSQPVFDDIGRLSGQIGETPSGLGGRSMDALQSLNLYERIESIPNGNLTVFLSGVEAIDEEFSKEMSQGGPLRRFETMLTSLTAPAFAALGRATVRNAMAIRLAKLGIAGRLFESKEGRFPGTLEELVNADLGIELGDVQPVGALPYGYRLEDGQATLWGFSPQTSRDSTPVDPKAAEEGTEEIWVWRLKPGSPQDTSETQ